MPAHKNTSLPPSTALVQRAGDAIASSCLWCSSFALLIIVGICGINVSLRYLFGLALSWAEEAMLYLMIAIVFMGAAAVTWSGSHLKIDAFVQRFPASARTMAQYLVAVFTIAVLIGCSMISFQVVSLLYSFGQRSEALEIPIWIPQGVVCAGFGLMALLTAMRLLCANDTASKELRE